MITKVKEYMVFGLGLLESKPWLAAMLVGVVNLLFRLPGTDATSIWLDEAQTMYQVQRDMASIIEDYVKQQQNAPLYFLLVHWWVKLLGISVFSVRLFSVVCMALAGAVMYLFARRVHSAGFALGVSLLFLGVNDFMFYAHEARGYALVALEAVASFYLFYLLLTHPSWRRALAVAALNLALLYTHYLTVYVFMVQGIVTIYWLGVTKNLIPFKWYLGSQLFVALLFLPWIPVVLHVMPQQDSFWISDSSWSQLENIYFYLINGKIKTYWVFSFLVLSLIWWIISRRNKKETQGLAFVLLLCWAFVPVLSNYALGFKVPVFLARYTFYASLGFLLFFAYNLIALPLPRWAVVIIFGLCISYNFKSLKFESEKREDWISAIEYVKSKHKPSESLVFAQRNYVYKAFYVYYNPAAFASVPDLPGHARTQHIYFGDAVHELERALKEIKPKRVVYLRTHWTKGPEGDPIENYLNAIGSPISQLEKPRKVEVFEYGLP